MEELIYLLFKIFIDPNLLYAFQTTFPNWSSENDCWEDLYNAVVPTQEIFQNTKQDRISQFRAHKMISIYSLPTNVRIYDEIKRKYYQVGGVFPIE